MIADELLAGASQAAIAAQLGRPRCTISRELRRNRHPGRGDYQPYAAHRQAAARRPRPEAGELTTG
ncbi:helix-turn-helix domain-containing protein [Actinoplanes sp. CA-054009]